MEVIATANETEELLKKHADSQFLLFPENRKYPIRVTPRLPWSGNPTHLWKVWDESGIEESKMFGYWSPSNPVKTDNNDILATAYVKKGKTLISIASWAKERVSVHIKIDWNALGINPKKAQFYAPFIKDFQEQATFAPTDSIPVDLGKGWLLIVSEKELGHKHKSIQGIFESE